MCVRISAGADPNAATNNSGSTPLILAVYNNHLETVRILTTHKNRADINRQDKKGFQAIHKAAQDGRAEILRLLLDAGAVPNALSVSGDKIPPLLQSTNPRHPARKTKIARAKSYVFALANRVWTAVKGFFITLKNSILILKNRFTQLFHR